MLKAAGTESIRDMITYDDIRAFTAQCRDFLHTRLFLFPIHNPVRRHWTLAAVVMDQPPADVRFL